MVAAHHALRALVCAAIVGLVSLSPALADRVVYHDALAADWQNWSWSTTINFNNASPAVGGTGASMRVVFNSAWAGVFLHSDDPAFGADFASVRFSIHGGSGGQGVRFTAYDASNAVGESVNLGPLTAGWTTVTVSFAQLGLTSVGGLIWQDTTGAAQPAFYIDEISFIAGPPPVAPALSVDAAQDRKPINEDIYGMNWASDELLTELRVPVHRWGGNSVTRYNWQNDTSNRASDWYFENIPNDNDHPEQLPFGSSSDRFVQSNIAAGADTLLTIPMIGWTPKSRTFDCGFRISRYGAQQSVDPWQPDCGNGLTTNGQPISGNEPNDTSIAIGPAFVQQWMNHLITQFGSAANGGVRYYNLDNEPMLWNSTHRDVHPNGCGYDELRDRTIQHATAIKIIDPAAKTLGPVFWGWTAYFYSALDIQLGGGQWWNTRPDRMAHGDMPLVEWYLQQMRQYEQTNGVRLLDYLDLHYYPQADVALQPAGDAAKQARRLRSTRSLWDPTYVDESWIAEPARLIPRMRDWVATRYPGTKLAMTEYNWGAYEHINGALAHADVLGIFGREGLDLATLWTAPAINEPVAFAFRMFRNYDGDGGSFGQTSVRAQSTDQGRVSVYAAETSGGGLTVLLINKTVTTLSCPLTIASAGGAANARVYRYSDVNLGQILRLADLPLSGSPLTPESGAISLPASSLTLLVLAPSGCAGDADCDGDVDFFDIDAFVARLGCPGSGPACNTGCQWQNADVDQDGDVDFFDIDPFVARLGEICP